MRCVGVDLLKEIPWGKINIYNWDGYLLEYQKQEQRILGVVCIRNSIG